MRRPLLFLLLWIAALAPAAAQSTIFVVRHAEKAETHEQDPKLSAPGRDRAEALARILKDAQISAIYVTEFKRTKETAAPLAKVLGLTPTAIPANDLPSLLAKIRSATGNVLVVGHGNTIPDLLKALGIPEPITIDDSDYSNLFLVFPNGTPHLIHLHFR